MTELLNALHNGTYGNPLYEALKLMADKHGVGLYPAVRIEHFGNVGAARETAKASFDFDQRLGPFICTKLKIQAPTGARLSALRTGARNLVVGSGLTFGDAFEGLFAGFPCAPIIVKARDRVVFELTMDPAADVDADDGVLMAGYHVRDRQGREAPEAAAKFLHDVFKNMGEMFIVNYGLAGANDDDGFDCPTTGQIEFRRIVYGDLDDGDDYILSASLKIGGLEIFPDGLVMDAGDGVLTDTHLLECNILLRHGERFDVSMRASASTATFEVGALGAIFW